jgi:hypothetical protein
MSLSTDGKVHVLSHGLAINLAGGAPLVSLATALLVAALLQRMWVKAGKPTGIRNIAAQSEGGDGPG